MSTDYDISIIVPTVGRSEDLVNCLSSIANQTVSPREILIIDDGEMPESYRTQLKDTVSIPICFTSSSGPSGTSTARNTGVEIALSSVILIVDDDVRLGPRYIEQLKRLYNKHDGASLAGIGGFDSNLRSKSRIERLYDRIFTLVKHGWVVNKAGIQSWDATIVEEQKADWLSGNNASYKREVLLEYPFPHWEGGREALEDVAMGLKLKQEDYTCVVDPSLPVTHEHSEGNETPFEFGYKRGRNRVRIFSEVSEGCPVPVFGWVLFGDIFRQFLAPIMAGSAKRHFLVGFGMLIGSLTQSLSEVWSE